MTERPLVTRLMVAVSALMFMASPVRPAVAAEVTPELRRQIIEAGMAPWSGRAISLDETLRDSKGDRASLRQFVGQPILAYNYAQW